MTRRSILQLSAASAAFGGPAAPVADIRGHGARGDGKTNDAPAIQRAIDACAAAGGGVVFFPPGTYVSGTLFPKSRVTLHLSPGATLQASRNLSDYRPRHLIYADNVSQIAIEGGGTIDGQGDMSWDENFRIREQRLGPLIELVGSRDIQIRDVHIRNSPRWTIHPKNCDRVWIRGISIVNHLRGLNTDGIDPDSSRNVHISDCYIEAGDDCIVLKATGAPAYRPDGYGEPVRPCENVTVTNCTLVTTAAALKLGTESLAAIRNCAFSNCVIRNSRVGLALYCKDGGAFENVSFSNILIETQDGGRASWPILIDLERRWKESAIGAVRNVSFSDIQVSTAGRVLLNGMPEQPLENITFRNVRLSVTGFGPLSGKPRGAGAVQPVPKDANFGRVPAALICAHVRGLDLRDVSVRWQSPEAPPQDRYALYAAGVEGLRIDGFTGRQALPSGELAAVGLKNCRDVFITGSRAETGANAFTHLDGTPAEEVLLAGNDLRKARRPSR